MAFGVRSRTVVESIRETILADVHFGEVHPAPGRPTVLLIEGPGALNGTAERAVLGHERSLSRAGFRQVECIGVDPHDDRGRHGRFRASVPEPSAPWTWERLTGAELQARMMDGSELRPAPRPVEPESVANVIAFPPRRRRK